MSTEHVGITKRGNEARFDRDEIEREPPFRARCANAKRQSDRQWIQLKSFIIRSGGQRCRVIAPPLPRIYCGRIYKRASARVARCGGERACNAAPLSFIIPVYTIPGDSFTTIRAAGASPER